MKPYIYGFWLLVFSTFSGCDRTSKPGGPGAVDPNAQPPLYGQADNSFRLTVSAAVVKPGESTEELIGIKRGTNFSQDVRISLTELPAGVIAQPETPVITRDSSNVRITLVASETALAGDYTIKVSGHPVSGETATNEFNLTVGKKDSFTLRMPSGTTALRQGETKVLSCSIKRDAQFDQDVTLTFGQLPKGVTIEPMSGQIKNGENDAKFSLKATDDAAIGDFTVQSTGHPTKGVDVRQEFKFTVTKK